MALVYNVRGQPMAGGGSGGGGGGGDADALGYKNPARVASTAWIGGNVNVAAPGAAIDSVALAAGDRVLLQGQAAPAENGLWTWNGAAAPMTRPSDFDASADVPAGHAVVVTEGAQNRGSYFNTNVGAIALGATALTYRAAPTHGTVASQLNAAATMLGERTAAAGEARFWSRDAANNWYLGETSVQTKMVCGPSIQMFVGTYGGAPSTALYYGDTSTHSWRVNNSFSTLEQMRMTGNALPAELILGQRENDTGAVPVPVPLRGSEAANTFPAGPGAGVDINAGASRGLATVSSFVRLGGSIPGTGGGGLQTKGYTFAANGQWIEYRGGRRRNARGVAGGNTNITVTDDVVEYTAAPGTGNAQLPAANAVPAGWEVWLVDRFGGAAGGTPITAVRAGADTINGAGANVTITTAFGTRVLRSDGVSNWHATAQF